MLKKSKYQINDLVIVEAPDKSLVPAVIIEVDDEWRNHPEDRWNEVVYGYGTCFKENATAFLPLDFTQIEYAAHKHVKVGWHKPKGARVLHFFIDPINAICGSFCFNGGKLVRTPGVSQEIKPGLCRACLKKKAQLGRKRKKQ